MTKTTPSSLGNVITIDEQIKNHLDRVVRGSVEETLNALLDAEADRLFSAPRGRYHGGFVGHVGVTLDGIGSE